MQHQPAVRVADGGAHLEDEPHPGLDVSAKAVGGDGERAPSTHSMARNGVPASGPSRTTSAS